MRSKSQPFKTFNNVFVAKIGQEITMECLYIEKNDKEEYFFWIGE